MRTPYCAGLAGAIAIVCALIASRPATAAWPSDGQPLATGPAPQSAPVGIAAVNGDLLAFWTESAPGASLLRARRVTVYGDFAPDWPPGGRTVVSSTLTITQPVIAADGSDGALLAWYGTAGPTGLHGIFAV